MTPNALVVAVALSVFALHATAASSGQGRTPSDARLERVEQWFTTVLRHTRGRTDDDIIVVGKWSNAELQVLYMDAVTVVRILRTPSLASQNERLSVSVGEDRPGQPPRTVRYNVSESNRLKQIACAVGVSGSAPSCEWARSAIANDSTLAALASAAARVGDATGNFLLYRGAIVHTDVAMLGLAAPADFSFGSRDVRVSISDGRQTALSQPNLHWELARQLLDQVIVPGSTRPMPGQDDWVRHWYVATSAWMEGDGHHYNTHLDHGCKIFPDDPDLAMLQGAQHEAYASSSVQTAARSAVLPTGTKLEVSSERSELREAEKSLRRATMLKPDFAEAHIRLGHVLALMERDSEAADHLNRGLRGTDEPLLLYYGSLFLGAVEERLRHDDLAKAAYDRAAMLYPTAQSPLLGLSELARRAGRRDEALRQMEKVYGLESELLSADPWWTYTYAQGRHAEVVFELLDKPMRSGEAR